MQAEPFEVLARVWARRDMRQGTVVGRELLAGVVVVYRVRWDGGRHAEPETVSGRDLVAANDWSEQSE